MKSSNSVEEDGLSAVSMVDCMKACCNITGCNIAIYTFGSYSRCFLGEIPSNEVEYKASATSHAIYISRDKRQTHVISHKDSAIEDGDANKHINDEILEESKRKMQEEIMKNAQSGDGSEDDDLTVAETYHDLPPAPSSDKVSSSLPITSTNIVPLDNAPVPDTADDLPPVPDTNSDRVHATNDNADLDTTTSAPLIDNTANNSNDEYHQTVSESVAGGNNSFVNAASSTEDNINARARATRPMTGVMILGLVCGVLFVVAALAIIWKKAYEHYSRRLYWRLGREYNVDEEDDDAD
ncbi:uncharacterized protein LOC141915067 [Tubulanus polymorphus]|uniref:uncharacterized protein LOC141915067 n=1 Tax=Tubulanus polymorphus TaxID=672921 RepID=UPI003DA5EECB